MKISELLRAAVKYEASDLHVQVGSPPSVRIHGDITPLDAPPLTLEDVDALVEQIADEPTLAEYKAERSADFSYVIPDVARFRVNAYYESGKPCLCLRQIPIVVPELESLNLPDAIGDIAACERGLVLVTGTTGSGKSTGRGFQDGPIATCACGLRCYDFGHSRGTWVTQPPMFAKVGDDEKLRARPPRTAPVTRLPAVGRALRRRGPGRPPIR